MRSLQKFGHGLILIDSAVSINPKKSRQGDALLDVRHEDIGSCLRRPQVREDEPPGDSLHHASNLVTPPEDHAERSRSCGKGKISSFRCREAPSILRELDGRSTLRLPYPFPAPSQDWRQLVSQSVESAPCACASVNCCNRRLTSSMQSSVPMSSRSYHPGWWKMERLYRRISPSSYHRRSGGIWENWRQAVEHPIEDEFRLRLSGKHCRIRS